MLGWLQLKDRAEFRDTLVASRIRATICRKQMSSPLPLTGSTGLYNGFPHKYCMSTNRLLSVFIPLLLSDHINPSIFSNAHSRMI